MQKFATVGLAALALVLGAGAPAARAQTPDEAAASTYPDFAVQLTGFAADNTGSTGSSFGLALELVSAAQDQFQNGFDSGGAAAGSGFFYYTAGILAEIALDAIADALSSVTPNDPAAFPLAVAFFYTDLAMFALFDAGGGG
jgi:hypothetical protein